MARFVLVPGAGGAAWYWSRVVPLLVAGGHDAVAVDLHGDDEAAGLPEYAGLVLAAVGDTRDTGDVVLVAQSLGGFSTAMAADRLVSDGRPPTRVVLLNAMVPLPGETPGDWWDAVGQSEARIAAARDGGWSPDFDLDTYFLHDVDPAVAAEGMPHQRPEADAVFSTRCAIDRWPDVPTTVLSGRDDRFFPLALQQRVARERLGLEAVVVPGGHLAALSQPAAVVDALLAG
jgi:pimeloyl-ACP methyl ester carboxylesterase